MSFSPLTLEGDKTKDFPLLLRQLAALIEHEPNRIANLANAAGLLAHFLDEVNWVGFYLREEGADGETPALVLGPFQGLPACVRISWGSGVCGTAAAERTTQRVADVHQFPGHIACDSASESEIVVPLIQEGEVIGVLDIDSPVKGRFDAQDQHYLEEFARILAAAL
jgi:GAF domain-containing protein